jgi:hypothetical protein
VAAYIRSLLVYVCCTVRQYTEVGPTEKNVNINLIRHLLLLFLLFSSIHILSSLIHRHYVPEGLNMLSCSLILKMKLVPPSLPRSSYVSSSFWFIL